jgi:hypothetical protein
VRQEIAGLDRHHGRDGGCHRQDGNYAPEEAPDRTQMRSSRDRSVLLAVSMHQHCHVRIFILLSEPEKDDPHEAGRLGSAPGMEARRIRTLAAHVELDRA